MQTLKDGDNALANWLREELPNTLNLAEDAARETRSTALRFAWAWGYLETRLLDRITAMLWKLRH